MKIEYLKMFGMKLCAWIKEVNLHTDYNEVNSINGKVFVLYINDGDIRRANILLDTEIESEYVEELYDVYKKVDYILCEGKYRLDAYVSCERIMVGFFYRFKADLKGHDINVREFYKDSNKREELINIISCERKKNELNYNNLFTRSIVFYYETNNEIIGVLVLMNFETEYFVNFLYVNNNYRNQGIAKKMLFAASDYVYKIGKDFFYGMSPYYYEKVYKVLEIVEKERWVLWKKKI